MFLIIFLLIILTSCHTGVVNPKGTIVIQETEDNIITGARKMIYNDSLLALIDVSALELFIIKRDGEIVKKITPKEYYSDSITDQILNISVFKKAIKFDQLKSRFPAKDQHVTISNYYTHHIYDCTFFENNIGYSSLLAAFLPESDTSFLFGVSPYPGFITESVSKNNNEVTVDCMEVLNNVVIAGTNELFYYGKYSNTFISNCYTEYISRPEVNLDTLNFKLHHRFIEYDRDIEPIKLVQNYPEELASKSVSLLLKDRITQTSDSAFWSIGNYHDIVYNLKNGEKFQLNTPGNNCAKYIERFMHFERNFKDSLRIMHKVYKDYLNFQVLSIDATPEDELIIDLLHAVINQETGEKEQYHILQKYSRSGELLGEKVFPQDGKLGSLQRIAYCATRDEFAFLIFKDEKWLLAYSEEDKVW